MIKFENFGNEEQTKSKSKNKQNLNLIESQK